MRNFAIVTRATIRSRHMFQSVHSFLLLRIEEGQRFFRELFQILFLQSRQSVEVAFVADPALPPDACQDGVDSILLECTRRLPFLSEPVMQAIEFVRILPRKHTSFTEATILISPAGPKPPI